MGRLSVVVEGDGDQGAVPVLVRAHLWRLEEFNVEVGKPINAKGRPKLLRAGELERFVGLACGQRNTSAVLVVCDADVDPACTLGPEITARCMAASRGIPIRACLAVRCFENWIRASGETLAPGQTEPVADYEGAGAIAEVKRWLAPGSYVKPVHQPKLTSEIDLDLAAGRCPSLARFLRCVDELLPDLREEPTAI